MIRRNITIPEELWERIQQACYAEERDTCEHVSASEIIRRAVRFYLAQADEPTKGGK